MAQSERKQYTTIMRKKNNCGVMYYVGGLNAYAKEVILAAESLKSIHPDINVCLAYHDSYSKTTDILKTGLFSDSFKVVSERSLPKYFDETTKHFLYRIQAFLNTPFESTLYLDTDTLIRRSLKGLFVLLHRFDFAAAAGPITQPPIGLKDPTRMIPSCFPELNAGVLLFKKNQKVISLLGQWYDYYLNNKQDLFRAQFKGADQVALRYLLWKNKGIAFGILNHNKTPNMFNFRYKPKKTFNFEDDIVIQHGRFKPKNKEGFEEMTLPVQAIFPSNNGICRRIIEEVRSCVNENLNWIDEKTWISSLRGYGILKEDIDKVNEFMGAEISHADLLCFLSLSLHTVEYLEIDISIGKNILPLFNYFRFANVVGLDVDEMCGRLRKFVGNNLKTIAEGAVTSVSDKTGEEHIIKTKRENFTCDLRGNTFSYVRGDRQNRCTWDMLKDMKFSLIFSNAPSVGCSHVTEVDYLADNKMFSEELIYVWDNVTQRQPEELRVAINILNRYYLNSRSLLVFTNVRGINGAVRKVAIFFSDRALVPAGLG